MKKLGVVLVSVMFLVTLVGCGNTKTLTCKTSEDGLEGIFVTNFKNDELVSGE